MGWIFPAKDLEILDDPIPDKLYCGRNNCTPMKLKGYTSHANEDVSEVENGLEMKSSERQQQPPPNGDGPFNITDEMNNCDLWKHMVSNLEKESPSAVKHNGVKTNLMSKFDEAEVDVGDAGEVVAGRPGSIGQQPLLYKSTEV